MYVCTYLLFSYLSMVDSICDMIILLSNFYLLCSVLSSMLVVVVPGRQLQMGFQDVVFLPSRASLYATFL